MDNKSPELKNFFESQLPSIVRNLQRIADCQEMTTGKKPKEKTVAPSADAPSVVFVCYEENSVSLYTEAGNINHLFVTADVELAKEWAERAFSEAEKNGFHPIEKTDKDLLFDNIGIDPYASVWVYKERKENARDNYGICVDFFELGNSKELLNSMFS